MYETFILMDPQGIMQCSIDNGAMNIGGIRHDWEVGGK
jgi:hypothetical protein